MAATIALIAHDRQKDNLVEFIRQREALFSRYSLIATANTGQRLQRATDLEIQQMASGAQGGEVQIAAEVVSGNVVAVIALVDPGSAKPQEPDMQTLARVCNFYNVLFATNLATAEAIAQRLAHAYVAHLIFNPVAGRGAGDADLDQIRQQLEPHLHLVIHSTTADTDLGQLVREAVDARADIVIASGGDGTVSEVAAALVNTDIPLGLIPRGTANAFASSLGIPSAIAPLPAPINQACQVILDGYTCNVDVARCNDRPMILMANVGYEAETVEKATRELKTQWGALAYIMAGWKQLDDMSLFNVEIDVDGTRHSFESGAITVANAAPTTSVMALGGGRVQHDDGRLDVTIASAESKLHAIQTMFSVMGAALVNTENQQKNVVHFYAKHVKLTTDPPQKVVLDGEMLGTTPIEVECIPNGLTVLVPKP